MAHCAQSKRQFYTICASQSTSLLGDILLILAILIPFLAFVVQHNFAKVYFKHFWNCITNTFFHNRLNFNRIAKKVVQIIYITISLQRNSAPQTSLPDRAKSCPFQDEGIYSSLERGIVYATRLNQI